MLPAASLPCFLSGRRTVHTVPSGFFAFYLQESVPVHTANPGLPVGSVPAIFPVLSASPFFFAVFVLPVSTVPGALLPQMHQIGIPSNWYPDMFSYFPVFVRNFPVSGILRHHFSVYSQRLPLPFSPILLLSHPLQNHCQTLPPALRFLPVLLSLSTVYQIHTFFLIPILIPSSLLRKTSRPLHPPTSFLRPPGLSEADRLPGSG